MGVQLSAPLDPWSQESLGLGSLLGSVYTGGPLPRASLCYLGSGRDLEDSESLIDLTLLKG